MKTLLSTLVLFCVSALLVACNSDQTETKSNDYQVSIEPEPAVVTEAYRQPDPVLAASIEAEELPDVASVKPAVAGTGAQLSKHDGMLYIATSDGMFSCSGRSWWARGPRAQVRESRLWSPSMRPWSQCQLF
jgi:hypothetical protein